MKNKHFLKVKDETRKSKKHLNSSDGFCGFYSSVMIREGTRSNTVKDILSLFLYVLLLLVGSLLLIRQFESSSSSFE